MEGETRTRDQLQLRHDQRQPPKTMEYTYSGLTRAFRESRAEAVRTIREADEEIFGMRPAEGTWCAAECFDHVVQFNRRYLSEMREAAEQVRRLPEDGSEFRPRLPVRWVIRFFEPPYRMKIKTLRPFYPGEREHLDREKVLASFRETQEGVLGLLEQAREKKLDLGEVRAAHPLYSFISLSLADCFGLVLSHQHRHRWQAEQVMEAVREAAGHAGGGAD